GGAAARRDPPGPRFGSREGAPRLVDHARPADALALAHDALRRRSEHEGPGGGARGDREADRSVARRPEGLPPVPERPDGRPRDARAGAPPEEQLHDGPPRLADAPHPDGAREGDLGPRRP